MKDQRRHRYTDMDESLSWVNVTQKEIDAIWSELANDMENDVLKKDRVKKKLWCKYKEGRKLIQSAYKKERQNEMKVREMIAWVLYYSSSAESVSRLQAKGKTLRQMDTEADVS